MLPRSRRTRDFQSGEPRRWPSPERRRDATPGVECCLPCAAVCPGVADLRCRTCCGKRSRWMTTQSPNLTEKRYLRDLGNTGQIYKGLRYTANFRLMPLDTAQTLCTVSTSTNSVWHLKKSYINEKPVVNCTLVKVFVTIVLFEHI